MSQRGFTLIEMALVLLVAGLMIGGGLLAVGPLIDKARINQTNATMDQVENALVLFVIRNNYLPCPALGATAATDAANYGIEQRSGGTCKAIPSTGIIPWRTLGIDESYSVDGWGNRLSYFPADGAAGPAGLSTIDLTSTATPAPLQRKNSGSTPPCYPYPSVSATDHFLQVIDASTSQPVTPTTVTAPASSTCQYIADQAAYVLVSHGKSGWYGWTKNSSTRAALFAGGMKSCNNNPTTCSVANSFVSGNWVGSYPPTSNSYFDDIVRWRSPAFLIQLCGSGACGN